MCAATKAFTELELVEGMKAGDEKVFKELHRMYSLTLLNIIDRIIHDDTAKFDILQDVMAKIWKHGDAYDRTKGSLFTWMLNVTRNHTIDVIRSKQYALINNFGCCMSMSCPVHFILYCLKK